MESTVSIYPMKLKDTPESYAVVTLERKEPFFVRKNQPETEAVVSALRDALDLNKAVLISVAPDDSNRILHARLEKPAERTTPTCPDRPEMTRAFWTEQEAVIGPPPDYVRWVTKVPNCSSYRVSFFRSPSSVWVHEQHPAAREMLELAWKSINQDVEVRAYVCKSARAFLVDLKESKP